MSKTFIELNSPWHGRRYDFKTGTRGVSVSDDILRTLIGKVLSVSCLAKPGQPPEFFDKPSRFTHQEHEITERNIGMQLKALVTTVHELFLTWLRQKETKSLILNWIGLVLYAFRDRSKMWTNEMIMSLGSSAQPSDGFMLNFSNVLLELCKPFSEPYSPKLLKIDARYCIAKQLALDTDPDTPTGAHMRNLNEETMIVQSEKVDTSRLEIPDQFNFMTEIFYATHKAMQIGFRSCHERLLKLASDMSHIQHVYDEARVQAGPNASDMLARLEEQQDKGMSQYLSMKAILMQQDTLELLTQFYIASCTWLNNLGK